MAVSAGRRNDPKRGFVGDGDDPACAGPELSVVELPMRRRLILPPARAAAALSPGRFGAGMRVRFGQAVGEGWTEGGRITKPPTAADGYTPHTVVTEWLILNCRGLWAAEGRGATIEVRFADLEDAEKARRHFSYLMT